MEGTKHEQAWMCVAVLATAPTPCTRGRYAAGKEHWENGLSDKRATSKFNRAETQLAHFARV